MPKSVGVLVMEHIAVGLVEDNKLAGPLSIYPEKGTSLDALQSMPAENIGDCIRQQIESVAKGQKIHSLGLGFLDLEPEEVFENARTGDARCADFVNLCHRALAAATATSIHMDGPGQFYITGRNAKFIEIALLDRFVHEMVKMSPLQGSRFEVVPTSDEVGIIGAALNAERAASA